jgi:hypothetical protein
MKERFLIDQLTTTNANLVDQIGRMQTHIEGLWEEVGFKNEKINDLHNANAELHEKEVRRAQREKNLADIFESERTDN